MDELRPNESFVERIIRQAIERGEFDDVPGTGEPIPGAGTPDSEGWWIRRWVQRNREQSKDAGRIEPGST